MSPYTLIAKINNIVTATNLESGVELNYLVERDSEGSVRKIVCEPEVLNLIFVKIESDWFLEPSETVPITEHALLDEETAQLLEDVSETHRNYTDPEGRSKPPHPESG